MDSTGWIKLHRTLISDDSTFQLLTSVQQIIAVHIILRANIQTKLWVDYKSGIKLQVKRGQLVCSLAKILSWFPQNEEGDISIKRIRTALAKFHALEFITSESTNRYTLLTIINYDQYQADEGTTKGTAKAHSGKGFQRGLGTTKGTKIESQDGCNQGVELRAQSKAQPELNPEADLSGNAAHARATTKELLFFSHEKNKIAGAETPAVSPVEKKQKPEKPKKTYHPEAHTVTRKLHALIGLQGVNTQRFFADLNTADKLLKAYRMTGTELESAIVWLLGDRFVGPAIGGMKAVERHFTLWLNRDDPNVKQRQKNAQTNTAKPSSALFGNQIVPAEHRKGGIIEL